MGTRIWPWWASGAIAAVLIAALTLLPMVAMLIEAGSIAWSTVLGDTYVQRVVRFSLLQATLSTLLSILFAIPVALALSHKPRFTGRSVIVTLFSLSLVIPTIVAIYGIVAVFGRTGWISALLNAVSLPTLDLYGLNGILIAHVFFNMPLATRILLVSLEGIPNENWRLATQLGMKPVSLFRFLEWPALRGQLPGTALLIFTLCFTSFAIVMTLGGGPRATTIEVAIYQALRFDFDIEMTVALAVIQLIICFVLMVLSTLFKHNAADGTQCFALWHRGTDFTDAQAARSLLWRDPWLNSIHWLIIGIASLYVILPLIALIVSAMNSKTLVVLLDGITLRAMLNSIMTSLASATLALSLTMGLLVSTRHLRIRLGKPRSGQWLQLVGNVILVLPPLVLGTGLFLLLRPFADVFSIALVLVILINSLMALPFALRLLDAPVMRSASMHDKLLQALGVHGWNRWRLIDWPQLRRPIALAFALSATLSAGDLTAIALFGSERIRTLPLLLYQRMGSYRLEEAAVTAGMLLLLCLLLFAGLQKLGNTGRYADA